MTEYCPYCGTILRETNLGNWWCPNCGKINKIEEKREENGGSKKYIG